MALFVAHGRLIFMFNAGHQKIRIKSQEKYNDGLWHNVSKIYIYICYNATIKTLMI